VSLQGFSRLFHDAMRFTAQTCWWCSRDESIERSVCTRVSALSTFLALFTGPALTAQFSVGDSTNQSCARTIAAGQRRYRGDGHGLLSAPVRPSPGDLAEPPARLGWCICRGTLFGSNKNPSAQPPCSTQAARLQNRERGLKRRRCREVLL